MNRLLLVGIFWVGGAIAASKPPRQVIDLGQLQIEGAARGPEIQLIDSQKMDPQTASRIVRKQLEEFEGELLKSEIEEVGK